MPPKFFAVGQRVNVGLAGGYGAIDASGKLVRWNRLAAGFVNSCRVARCWQSWMLPLPDGQPNKAVSDAPESEGKQLPKGPRMHDYIAGIDARKRTHTIVVVDAVGKKHAEKTIPATSLGHESAIKWVRKKFGPIVTWAVEDCRSLTARLDSSKESSHTSPGWEAPFGCSGVSRRHSSERRTGAQRTGVAQTICCAGAREHGLHPDMQTLEIDAVAALGTPGSAHVAVALGSSS